MSNEPKPRPCPFCAQELVKTEDNYGLAWKHPYKPGVCIALGIALGGSGDIAEWNHRPAEMKLALAIEALEGIKELYMGDDMAEQRDYYRMADRALAKIRP